jgi:hypothetical protein
MLADSLNGSTERLSIEYVLQYSDTHDEIELLARVELGEILHKKATAMRDSLYLRAPLCFGDHRRTQIHTGDCGASGSQHRTPATHAAPHVEHACTWSNLQPGFEREPLTTMNHPIVEFRHTVGAHGGKPGALRGKPLRTVLPVTARQITIGSGYAVSHDAFRIRLVFSSSGNVVLALGSGS